MEMAPDSAPLVKQPKTTDATRLPYNRPQSLQALTESGEVDVSIVVDGCTLTGSEAAVYGPFEENKISAGAVAVGRQTKGKRWHRARHRAWQRACGIKCMASSVASRMASRFHRAYDIKHGIERDIEHGIEHVDMLGHATSTSVCHSHTQVLVYVLMSMRVEGKSQESEAPRGTGGRSTSAFGCPI